MVRPSLLRSVVAALLLAVGLGFSSCSSSEAGSEVARVEPHEAVALIGSGDYTVLDVRTPEEYDAGHVAGALNIDVRDGGFEEQVDALDHDARYLVYSRAGKRSSRAADTMAGLGFRHVADAGAFSTLVFAGAEVE